MPDGEGGERGESSARIESVISRIEKQDDPRERFAIARGAIERYREAGDAVPEELLRMHKALESELIQASRGG